jgi:carbonic anhydrase
MKTTFAALVLAGLFTSGALAQTATPKASASPHAHWSYEGEHGPDHWAALDPAYALCAKGMAQSPIDITKVGEGTGNNLKLDYGTTSLQISHHEHVSELVDNGHTIQVTVEEGSTLTTARNTYRLRQFHFHTPSEHTFDGKYLPMEAHFVHQSADGRLAVVAVLFAEGPANENLAKLISNFPAAKGQSANLPAEKLDLNLQLPAKKAAYTYIGSLTTPPCSEDVEWIVFRDPMPASREQLSAFAARLQPNNRPIQPLNGRTIKTTTAIGKINE